jgi:hypothetical protein
VKGEGYFGNRVNGESSVNEAAVMTCAHCQKILYLHSVPGQPNWREDGGWCRSEMKPLCGPCADRALTYGCEPALKKVESYGNALVKYQQYLKVAGLEPAKPAPLILPD